MVEHVSNLHWVGGINKRNREPFEPKSSPEIVCIDLSFELTPLVDPMQKGELQNRIKEILGSLSQELGFRILPVGLYEGLDLQSYQYRISVNGVLKGEGECFPDKLKAICYAVNLEERLPGERAEEFGGLSESIWILKDTKEDASASGYFCIDSENFICVHLNELMRSEAHQLLGYDETHQRLQSLWKTHPAWCKYSNEPHDIVIKQYYG